MCAVRNSSAAVFGVGGKTDFETNAPLVKELNEMVVTQNVIRSQMRGNRT